MTLSVLLIESDAVHANAIVKAMAGERPVWRLEVARSVAHARELLASRFFDVIVASHSLPDGSALDLAVTLSGKPVILSVVEGEEKAAAHAMRRGFSDYLVKDPRLAYLQVLTGQVETALRNSDMARHLRESALRFELALDGAGLGLWDQHLPSGKVSVSERVNAMLGYSLGDVGWGSVWRDVVHPDDWPAVQAASDAHLKGLTPMYQCEYRLRHKEGYWVWVLSRGRVMERDAAGMPVRVLGTYMDITERKQTRDEFDRHHRLLQAISRAQSIFITSIDAKAVFEGVLTDLLAVTGSEYGFVGEVLFNDEQLPFLKVHAISNLAWDDASRHLHEKAAAGGMKFTNLKSLLGAALAIGEPVIANEPQRDPRRGGLPHGHPPVNAFLGIPIHNDGELVAMVGLANQPGGYSQADIDFLDPLCSTIGQLVQARRSDVERRRIQAELQKTSELLEQRTQALDTTLDSIVQGINTVDADGRTVVYNRRYVDLLELPESMMAARPTHEEIVQFQTRRGDFGQDYELVDPAARKFMAGGRRGKIPERFLRKTRAGRTLEVRTRDVPAGGMVRTFSDVTDYVEAQAALLESETRFRGLTELSSDWYWEQDEQFRFVRMAGKLEDVTGIPNSAHIGLTRWESGALGVTEEQWAAHRAVLQAHQTFHDFEMQRPGADGELRWVSVSGVPIVDAQGVFCGYRGIGREITEHKRAEQELAKTRELLEQKALALEITLDSMHQGIVKLDADGRVNSYNRRYLEMLDLPESLLATQPKHGDILRFQAERGEFGQNLDLVEAHARSYIARVIDGAAAEAPESYLFKSRSGRVLEIKTRLLPAGGLVRTFADVTSYLETQAALNESVARFRSLTDLSSDWYWELDEQFRFTRFDGYRVGTSSITQEASIGKTRWELGAANLTEEDWQAHRAVLQAHQTFHDFEIQRHDPEGRPYWVAISGVPIFDAEGRFGGYRGIGRDITKRKLAEDETQRLAFYDTLTGLPNRRLLLDRLTQAMAISARNQNHGALLFIDLDNFKDLNDTLGHDMGDKLLEQVASRLVLCIREGDTVARLGGDEFVIMLEGLSSNTHQAAAQAETVGEKITHTMNLPYDLLGKEHHSTPSIGITLFSGHSQSVDELLKRADLAMYQAKAAGRNTLRFFDPVMQAAVAERAALEVDLRHGLQNKELFLHYQAVVDGDGRLTGAEALARWQHPQRGMVLPGEFISLAEQTGLILPLGQWVLQTACEQLVAWAARPQTAHLTLAINVSARQFRQPEFVAEVMDVLARTGATPYLLKLELTESLLLNDAEDAILKMEEIRAIGVRFSLDDFGTGYSSLSYLKRLPLDQLKIDQSFVRDVLTDPNDAAIAVTILALAHSLDLAVVAEGVETEGQREFLARHGCKAFQGYLFGRPGPAEALPLASLDPAGDTPIHPIQFEI